MKNNRKKAYNSTTETVIDNSTGEVLKVKETKKIFKEAEPNYIKLYLRDLMRLKNLPGCANDILYLIIKNMDYENKIYVTPSVKDKAAKSLNISKRTIERSIVNYVDKGIMTKIDKVTYLMNPSIFGRGNWQNIKEIRMLVSYSKRGRLLLNYEEKKRMEKTPTLFD